MNKLVKVSETTLTEANANLESTKENPAEYIKLYWAEQGVELNIPVELIKALPNFPAWYDQYKEDPEFKTSLLIDSVLNDIIGFAILSPSANKLIALYVAPPYQNKGVGAYVMASLLDIYKLDYLEFICHNSSPMVSITTKLGGTTSTEPMSCMLCRINK